MVAVQKKLIPEPDVVPATLDAIAPGDMQWRERFAWPARPDLSSGVLAGIAGRQLDAIANADDDLRDLLRIVRPSMALPALTELALGLAEEETTGLRLAGPPVLNALRGERVASSPVNAVAPPAPAFGPWQRWLRSLVRTATWTPLWRLPRAMIAPEATAVGHNSLLRAHVTRNRRAVRLEHLDGLADVFRGVRADARGEARADAAAETLLVFALDAPGLPKELAARIRAWLMPSLRAEVRAAASLCAGLRSLHRLPLQLLAGASGGLLGRAFAVEILRRGGEVTRFDHGGSAYLMPSGDGLALREFSVSSALAVASPKAARLPPVVEAAARTGGAIVAAAGDPGLDARSARRPVSNGRRHVMYVPTAFYRFRQVHPAVLPAPVYLDWQMRLVSLLGRMPVDLTCKPHPEGDRGGVQPIAAIAAVDTDRFEVAVARADVLIFDYPATTALSVALSTDRPIVLIDHGTMRFNKPVARMISNRCRIVPATWNDRNLPEVDSETLADAVLGGPERVDPSEFRALFLDDC